MTKKWMAIVLLAVCLIAIAVVLYPGMNVHRMCRDAIRAEYGFVSVSGYDGDIVEYGQFIHKPHLTAYINDRVTGCFCYVVKSVETGRWYASEVHCD